MLLLFILAGLSSSVLGSEYTLKGATEKAAALIGEEKWGEFLFFNLPEPKAKPADMLRAMRHSRDHKVVLAIGSPKLRWIHDLLAKALASSPSESFDGLKMIIVAEREDPKNTGKILEKYGIRFVSGKYEEEPNQSAQPTRGKAPRG